MKHLVGKGFILLIDFYRKIISPLTPPTCRFYPSCSHYTRSAIIKYGPVKGLLRGLKRLLKCHPWHPGGYDAV
jgi:putative membrane protein insertion efficiency factor